VQGNPKLARNTKIMYEWAVRVWLKPELGRITLEDLDTATIRRFYTRLLNGARRDGEAGKVSSSTARRVHATLHRALEYAVDMNYLPRNHASRSQPPPDCNPKIACWTPDEVARFLDATRSHADWPIWVLTVNTGLRWGDVQDQVLTVRRQVNYYAGEGLEEKDKTKSASGERYLPLTQDALAALRHQETHQKAQRLAGGPDWRDTGYIFTDAKGGALNPNDMARRFKRAVAKVPGVTPITFHKLRHTYVTMLRAAGVDDKTVAQLAGHSDPGFTARRYGEVQQHMIDRAAQALQSMMGSLTG
jgi:integrase